MVEEPRGPYELANEILPASVFSGVENGRLLVEFCPPKRAYHASCQAGTKFFIYGGCTSTDSGSAPYDDFYSFDLRTLVWTRIDASGPGPRCNHNMCYYDGQIYIFAGWNGRSQLDDMWCYNLGTKTWSEVKCKDEKKHVNRPTSHSSSSSCVVGRSWVMGREERGAHRKFTCDIEYFDFEQQTWDNGALFETQTGHTLTPVRTAFLGDMVLPPTDVAYELADSRHCGSPSGRAFHGIVPIPYTSHVLIQGGFLANTRTAKCMFNSTAELKLYNDRENSWSYLPPCLPARSAHTLAVFMSKDSDDTTAAYVLLFGGADRGAVFNDMWLQKIDLLPTSQVAPKSPLGPCRISAEQRLVDRKTATILRHNKNRRTCEIRVERARQAATKNQEWEKMRALWRQTKQRLRKQDDNIPEMMVPKSRSCRQLRKSFPFPIHDQTDPGVRNGAPFLKRSVSSVC